MPVNQHHQSCGYPIEQFSNFTDQNQHQFVEYISQHPMAQHQAVYPSIDLDQPIEWQASIKDSAKCIKAAAPQEHQQQRPHRRQMTDARSRRMHQRRAANQRERKRMRSINAAFDGLRRRLPIEQKEDRKLSKVETLKYAIQYIKNLAEVLRELEASEARANPHLNSRKPAKVILLCHSAAVPGDDEGLQQLQCNDSSGNSSAGSLDATSTPQSEIRTRVLASPCWAAESAAAQSPGLQVWGHSLAWRDERQALDPECRIRCPTVDTDEDEAEDVEQQLLDGGGRGAADALMDEFLLHQQQEERQQQQQQQHSNAQRQRRLRRRRGRRVRATLWTPCVLAVGETCGDGDWLTDGIGNTFLESQQQ
ncbi:hypothetical protein BOX15_Mlig020777g1 [Macrostomum lignano]|uniref:BHLH domain-containing protein n=1 Tax=Macrostomum lignano TaxID=282301 RepID=A0A267E3M9_9PLAT|nr:hypothetical protein BOX15_Mlig020777g1 [Macrostomum lignano]